MHFSFDARVHDVGAARFGETNELFDRLAREHRQIRGGDEDEPIGIESGEAGAHAVDDARPVGPDLVRQREGGRGMRHRRRDDDESSQSLADR